MSELRRAVMAGVCTVIISGPAWGGFQVNTYTVGDQGDSSVAVDGSGNFMVVWVSTGQDGGSWGIFAQRYDSGGTPLGSEFSVNPEPAGHQQDPAVAVADDGSVVVSWSGSADGDSFGISPSVRPSHSHPTSNERNTVSRIAPRIACSLSGEGRRCQ